MKVEKKMSF